MLNRRFSIALVIMLFACGNIPAFAGIYACRLHYRSRGLRLWIPACAGMTMHLTTAYAPANGDSEQGRPFRLQPSQGGSFALCDGYFYAALGAIQQLARELPQRKGFGNGALNLGLYCRRQDGD